MFKTLIDIRWDWYYSKWDGSYELWIGTGQHDRTYSGHVKPQCPACGGYQPSDYDLYYNDLCPVCEGNARVSWPRWLLWQGWARPRMAITYVWLERVWWPLTERDCPLCGGQGVLEATPDQWDNPDPGYTCPDCEGRGVVGFRYRLKLAALKAANKALRVVTRAIIRLTR